MHPNGFFAASTFWTDFQADFYQTFIEESRYKLFLEGLGNTLIIALFATLLGCLIGVLIACAKVASSHSSKRNKISHTLLGILNGICNTYVTIMRGTPVVVQLMILYFVVLKIESGVTVAIIGFGLNSGAYVSEIIRAGIMAVDPGQREAGRSLGLSSTTTMARIIMPQAIKNILPALGNEFITLLKETSVAGMITALDLTRASDLIRSNTMEPFFPLISTAIIYLILVMGMTLLFNSLERRMRKSDRR